jgi:hypothetical protein
MRSAYFAITMIYFSTAALADYCVSVEGSTVVNKCVACNQVTLRQLHPPEKRQTELFTGMKQTVRLEANHSVKLDGGEHWAIDDLKPCR